VTQSQDLKFFFARLPFFTTHPKQNQENRDERREENDKRQRGQSNGCVESKNEYDEEGTSAEEKILKENKTQPALSSPPKPILKVSFMRFRFQSTPEENQQEYGDRENEPTDPGRKAARGRAPKEIHKN